MGLEALYSCRIAGFDFVAAPLPAMGAKLTLCRGLEQIFPGDFVAELQDLERLAGIAPQ